MDADDEIPAGFERHFRRSPATDPWEPLWSRRAPGAFTIGLHVREAHCNARGLVHGGVLSALADNAMGLACSDEAGDAAGLLTVHLSVDYLASARAGQWLEVAARPERVGGTIAHGTAEIRADGEAVARASAVFRVVRRDKGDPKES